MAEFKLPDVGEGLTEAEIVSWKVKEGDTVGINEIICEIETAKSIVELPSPYAGTVTKLMVAEGEMVPVGTPIIAIGDPSAPEPEAPAASPEMEIDLSNPAASGGGEGESLVGRNKADRGPIRRARKGAASPSSEAGASTQLQLQGAFAAGGAESASVPEADEPAVPATSVATEPATSVRGACAGQAARAQARQGPRRRPRVAHRLRRRWCDHPRRRRGRRVRYDDPRRPLRCGPPASARPASRSRACAR